MQVKTIYRVEIAYRSGQISRLLHRTQRHKSLRSQLVDKDFGKIFRKLYRKFVHIPKKINFDNIRKRISGYAGHFSDSDI